MPRLAKCIGPLCAHFVYSLKGRMCAQYSKVEKDFNKNVVIMEHCNVG